MTRRGPHRSASQPTTGPAAPSSSSETAAAPESAARFQPKVASMGLMNTPNTARSPEPSSMTTTSAPRTTQAWCSAPRDAFMRPPSEEKTSPAHAGAS